MLPIVMVLILLLIQPGIILYDRIVMEGAAAEGCRLLTTLPSSGKDAGVDYVKRRLSAVPQQDLFHVHSGTSCSWVIELSGDETASEVSVSIKTEVKPLPLIGAGAALLGITNGSGNFEVRVKSQLASQPSWLDAGDDGFDPAKWIGAWV